MSEVSQFDIRLTKQGKKKEQRKHRVGKHYMENNFNSEFLSRFKYSVDKELAKQRMKSTFLTVKVIKFYLISLILCYSTLFRHKILNNRTYYRPACIHWAILRPSSLGPQLQ